MMFFSFQKGLEVAKVQAEDKDLNPFSYAFYPGLSCFGYFPFLRCSLENYFFQKFEMCERISFFSFAYSQ